jgi:hypothetical protein
MALRELVIHWEHIKTYATEATLRRKLAQISEAYPEHDDRYLVVQTPEGRWTAIVRLDLSKGGYIGRYDFLKV